MWDQEETRENQVPVVVLDPLAGKENGETQDLMDLMEYQDLPDLPDHLDSSQWTNTMTCTTCRTRRKQDLHSDLTSSRPKLVPQGQEVHLVHLETAEDKVCRV